MATWPTTLPNPLLSGYQGESGANVSRTDMDAGPPRQRLRYSDAPENFSLTFKFKPAEMQTFVSFHRVDINRGNDWFLMTLDIGEGFEEYSVRIVSGLYQKQALPGMNWQVSFKLEVIEI